MLIALAKIVFGILILSWSADKLVNGACTLAKILGVAPLLIGLTIVALGTSMPEVVISILASLKNNSGIALGNAFGSNIANIGLVIGCCAMTHSLTVESSTIQKEIPLLLAYTLVICVLIVLFGLNVWTASILLLAASLFIVWLIIQGKKQRQSEVEQSYLGQEIVHELPLNVPLPLALFYIAIGVILLPISANILVSGATDLALLLGISETVIGLTMVALGTSLPELAASVAATLKKEYGVAIGNVIGSNIFNLTVVLSPVGFISPNINFDQALLTRDMPVMVLLTVLFALFAYKNKSKPNISRVGGVIFVVIYLTYVVGLFAVPMDSSPT